MPACLPNIDGSASITFNLIYHVGFQVSIERWFQGERHDLNFRVVKTTCNSNSFFSLLAKFWVRLPLYCRKINGLSICLVLLFWCSFGVVLNWSLAPLIIFSRVWFTIFEDHSSGYWFLVQQVLFFFKSLIEGQPIRVCIKNPVNSPLNHIYLMLKRCTAAKIEYYSSVSWFLIPTTGDIIFAAHIYVNVKKNQIPIHVHFF